MKGNMLKQATQLFSVISISILLASATEDDPVQVTGLLSQSIVLSNYVSLESQVQDVIWYTENDGKQIKLAEYRNQQFEVINDQFADRLQASNEGTTLTIEDLRLEDSGVFIGYITLKNQKTKVVSFDLTVNAKHNAPIEVNIRLNQSVYLSNDLSLTHPVQEVTWYFEKEGKKVKLAEFKNQQFEIANNQFTDRLEASNNGTTLKIKNVRLEDNGVYTATITLSDQQTINLLFNLVVSDSDVPMQVNGLVNESALLSKKLKLTIPVNLVTWHFLSNGKKFQVAIYKNGQLLTTSNQFSSRLSTSNNGTKLRIKKLKMEDSGIFTAFITLADQESLELSYNLTVFEPVPSPNITVSNVKGTSEWCNFTLQCSVPTNASSLHYMWKTRQKLPFYQFYKNGSTVHIALKTKSLDTRFQCWVENPADQKTASIQLKNCPGKGKLAQWSDSRTWHKYVKIVLPICAISTLLLAIVKRKKIRQTCCPKESTPPEEGFVSSDPQYSAVQMTNPDANNQVPPLMPMGPQGPAPYPPTDYPPTQYPPTDYPPTAYPPAPYPPTAYPPAQYPPTGYPPGQYPPGYPPAPHPPAGYPPPVIPGPDGMQQPNIPVPNPTIFSPEAEKTSSDVFPVPRV